MGNLKQIGTVEEVSEVVCLIRGLPHVGMDEEIVFDSGAKGMILRLDEDYVYGVLLGKEENVRRGSEVMGTGKPLSVPVGEELLGRVVNPLGEPIDGLAGFAKNTLAPIEKPAPSIFERRAIKQQLETGVMIIDGMLPLGRGQRETIIGDPKSGKSNAIYTAILNCARLGIYSVYVTIGKPQSKTKAFVQRLKQENLLDKVIIVSGTASMSPTLNFIGPYSGTSMAEYLMAQGKDVLVCYDDLSQHAKYYRQLSLLLKRSPGREAYPGDVFYIHSRLLERAAALTDEQGGGSLTALPVIEINERDVTGYIPTNVLSITDGHILFDKGLFNQGIIPAIAMELSVSRLGGKVQCDLMKRLGVKIAEQLMQYRESQAFAHFGTDLAPETLQKIERGKRILEFLKQDPYEVIKIETQILYYFGLTQGYFDKVDLLKVKELKTKLIEYLIQGPASEIYPKLKEVTLKDSKNKLHNIFKIAAETLISQYEEVDKKKIEEEKKKEEEARKIEEEEESKKGKKKRKKKKKKDKEQPDPTQSDDSGQQATDDAEFEPLQLDSTPDEDTNEEENASPTIDTKEVEEN